LKALADGGLTTGCVLANLHHRQIVPLMERPLRIFEMHEDADPVALAQSWLLPDLFPREYAATRRDVPSTYGPAGTTTRRSGCSPCSLSARW
jgi:hypothetical protein